MYLCHCLCEIYEHISEWDQIIYNNNCFSFMFLNFQNTKKKGQKRNNRILKMFILFVFKVEDFFS